MYQESGSFTKFRCLININSSMAIQVVEFSSGGTKSTRFFAQESTYPKESIEF